MTQIPVGQLIAAVEHAAKPIAEQFGRQHVSEDKTDGTPVTPIDIKVNQTFLELAKSWNIGFIGEEGNGQAHSDTYLFVDPLDGTGAYARGMATATVIASVMRNGKPYMAVIHNPVTNQTWWSLIGNGAYYSRNGKTERELLVSKENPSYWRTAICAWPGVDDPFTHFKAAVLASNSFSDQEMGAFGIGGGMIASGTLHATAISATSAVESAAMSLIVTEAGGIAVDLHGNELGTFELGEHKGKQDFLLPNGAIFASTSAAAEALLALYKNN